MNSAVGDPRVGQWYARWDTGEVFQVIGSDPGSCTIDRRAFGGTLDSIDEAVWSVLPLAWVEPPEGWTDHRTGAPQSQDIGATHVSVTVIEWSEPTVG